MTDRDTPAEIAARLTPAQKRSREAIDRACCGDERCWAANDIDAYLPPGCAKCWALGQAVRAVLEKEQSDG